MRLEPILRYRDLSAPLSLDAAGTITARRFLADVNALSQRLPEASHIVNLCADRYRFAVGFFAALLRRQVTLLPSAEAAAPMAELLASYPDTYFLTDGGTAAPAASRSMVFPDALEAGSADLVPSVPADQMAAILFTSGSTGRPMPHPRSWGAMVNSTRAAARALSLEDLSSGHSLGTVPHQHSYGLESVILLALQHGFAVHRGRALLPGDIVRQLEALPRPRILVTTPIHLRSLLALDGPLPVLDRIICATAPLTSELAKEAESRFAAPLLEIYGCTEVGQMATRRTTETAEWTCISDILLQERDGDIWASGAAAAASAPVGDVLELIDARRFILKDRKADLVNIAGKRSSLGYLNRILTSVEGVRDGVFIMPPDASRLTAYVVAPGLSATALHDALRLHIDPAFLPRPIHFVDRLPRNELGKLTRQTLDRLRVEGDWSSHTYRFAPDHPTAAGHFPGNPIIPGALLLDRLLDAMGRAGIERQVVKVAKFLHPVRPGDAVTFRWREAARDVSFECVLIESGEVALSGSAAPEAT